VLLRYINNFICSKLFISLLQKNFLLIWWLPAADEMLVILGLADTKRNPAEEMLAGYN